MFGLLSVLNYHLKSLLKRSYLLEILFHLLLPNVFSRSLKYVTRHTRLGFQYFQFSISHGNLAKDFMEDLTHDFIEDLNRNLPKNLMEVKYVNLRKTSRETTWKFHRNPQRRSNGKPHMRFGGIPSGISHERSH